MCRGEEGIKERVKGEGQGEGQGQGEERERDPVAAST